MRKIAIFLIFLTSVSLFLFAAEKQSEKDRQKEVLQFGLESEIVALLDSFIKNGDKSFADEIYSVFNKTQSTGIREKTVQFFASFSDRRLADFSVSVLEDPYEYRASLVNAVFKYVTDLDIKEAVPAIAEIIKTDNDQFFHGAVTALGKLGGPEEALLLTEYIDRDYPLAQKQAIVRALGQLQAVETWQKLTEIAENPDENAFMRAYAAEAIGEMKKNESIPVLIQLYDDSDPIVRASVVAGLSNFSVPEAQNAVLEAFKDNYYKVRLEAAAAAEKMKLKEAVPVLIYRAKNDPENVVRMKSFETLSALGTGDAVDFLVSVVENTALSDASRVKAAAVLLKNQFNAGISAVTAAAKETLKDDRYKKLRYELGKELAKYDNAAIADICAAYLQSSDALTRGTGLDIYAKNFFLSASELVKKIAEDSKDSANQRKAKGILERGKN